MLETMARLQVGTLLQGAESQGKRVQMPSETGRDDCRIPLPT